MPITTKANKFPLLPLPRREQNWEDWAGRLVDVLEGFFASNPYEAQFPVGALSQPDLTSIGSSAITLQTVTAISDGRPLMAMANSFCIPRVNSSASTSWSLKLQRDNADIASIGADLIIQYMGISAFDQPATGKHVYKIVFQTDSSIADYKFRGRLLWIMDKPNA